MVDAIALLAKVRRTFEASPVSRIETAVIRGPENPALGLRALGTPLRRTVKPYTGFVSFADPVAKFSGDLSAVLSGTETQATATLQLRSNKISLTATPQYFPVSSVDEAIEALSRPFCYVAGFYSLRTFLRAPPVAFWEPDLYTSTITYHSDRCELVLLFKDASGGFILTIKDFYILRIECIGGSFVASRSDYVYHLPSGVLAAT